MDYTEDAIPADEWAAFSASSASMELSYADEERQALRKATKDLMSLNTDGNWDDSNNTSMMNRSPVIHPHFDDLETHRQQSHLGQHQEHHYQQSYNRVDPHSSRQDSFPFLHTKTQQQRQSQPIQFPIQQHPGSPLRTASPDSQQCSPNSPRSPYGFSQQKQLHQTHIPQQPPQQQRHSRGRETSVGTKPKRSRTPPSISPPFSRPSLDSPHKRQRLSPSEYSPTSAPGTTSASFSSPNNSSSNRTRQQQPSKPNLLSVSQKKANHIQSEQKRRANIRRGYAALCETVPALREAIREEEEAEKNAVDPNISIGIEAKTNSGGKKRRSKKGAAVDGKDLDDKDKEKTDGRAGPMSENMVLSKSMQFYFIFKVSKSLCIISLTAIEHIQHLLTERSSLLSRLQHAKASLPAGHPALNTLDPDPPWEKEWKGGEGKLNLGDGDGDEEGDRDGGSGDEEEGG